VFLDGGTVRGILHRKAPPVGLCQLALRRPIMRQGAGKGPRGFGGVGAVAVNFVVGELALVTANDRLPNTHPPHTTTHSPYPAPASVAPQHTCASVKSCRMLPARHAPARWACAPPRDTPGTPRPCRVHLFPLAQV
jgi:hypothetical protein